MHDKSGAERSGVPRAADSVGEPAKEPIYIRDPKGTGMLARIPPLSEVCPSEALAENYAEPVEAGIGTPWYPSAAGACSGHCVHEIQCLRRELDALRTNEAKPDPCNYACSVCLVTKATSLLGFCDEHNPSRVHVRTNETSPDWSTVPRVRRLEKALEDIIVLGAPSSDGVYEPAEKRAWDMEQTARWAFDTSHVVKLWPGARTDKAEPDFLRLQNEQMDRAWASALELIRKLGLDPEKVIAQAAANVEALRVPIEAQRSGTPLARAVAVLRKHAADLERDADNLRLRERAEAFSEAADMIETLGEET